MIGTPRDADRAEARVILERLRRDAELLCSRFELALRSLDPEGRRVKRRYGICYEDGSIRIRLRHATTGRLLKYSALVDTLCHELAHLRHFDHGARFQALYERILGYARRNGLYRPGRRDQPRPRVAPGSLVVPSGPELQPALPWGEPPRKEPPKRPFQLELFGASQGSG